MPPAPPRKVPHGPRSLADYAEIPLRRPLHMLVPLCLVMTVAVAASLLVPSKYRSSTLILVESEKVPESFVPNMATESSSKRLMTIRQEVLSRTRLERVVSELDPYRTLGKEPMTVAVERMREAIEISVKGNDAFRIDYVHRHPQTAMVVANRLATLFIEEVSRGREEQVAGAYRFIEAQLTEARQELEKRERTVRSYKEQHMGTLPEQMTANLSTLQRLQLEHQAVVESVRTAVERLRQLESDPAAAAAGTDPVAQELAQLRTQLVTLRLRYTEEHPDIKALVGRVARLEQQMARAEGAPSPRSPLEEARAEVKRLKGRQDELERRMGVFQARVEHSPRTEQELGTLNRDYQKLNEHYLRLLDKKLDAQAAADREKRWRGEHFRVLDPANLPEQPVFPNRLRFLAVGLVLGLLAGAGLCLVAEQLDHSINRVDELEAVISVPVLATIPHVARPPALRRVR